MPLISDSTKIYVGNTEISKVYAGSSLVWDGDGRNCDDAGKPGKPVGLAVATPSFSQSQYIAEWSRGSTATGWKTTTELKVAGSNKWTNKKTADFPTVYTLYNKTDFGPNASLQRQTEVRCQNIDPSGNVSCYVYTFPIN